MNYRRLPVRVLFLSIISVVALSATAGSAGSPMRAYVREKNNPVISAWSRQVIEAETKSGQAKIWVFFTDKGFFDDRGMAAAASSSGTQLSDRAAKRRAKMGRDRIEFVDLPVRQVYVDRVLDLGAQLRGTSRWLNAASFELEADRLDSLSALPFVHQIRPVIGLRREPEAIETESFSTKADATAQSAGVSQMLNYGNAQAQLDQINIPAAHNAGFRGQGVLVCMIDTGYRKDHTAFAQAFADGRVLDEYDFIFDDDNTQDEPEDVTGQHGHGTLTWSTLGGELDGTHYGPAFDADFLLAKTEDVGSETQVEEDNWVEAMEWADALGADVISSSLGYSDWYVPSDYNGDFCVTTKAADSATALGIVVCNSMGNGGPSPSSLVAPADADSILSVGAVTSTGSVSSFSSRGPTFDGRIKPEVCARGSSTACATASTTTSFGSASGTSLSTPLVGGAAAVVLSAHPTWTPMQVREALMQTASNRCAPNNNIGWGIIDVMAAINYDFCAEPAAPAAPFTGNPAPCAAQNYTIGWNPIGCATAYELYENSILVYDGALTQFTTNHAGGTFVYSVKAKNACGAGPASPDGGTTTVSAAPASPDVPITSTPGPCGPANYTVSWNSVPVADAYELYENGSLVFDGASTTYETNHASGAFNYYVIAKNACASGPQSPTGATTTIVECGCHADPVCDSIMDVADVVTLVGEAFRGQSAIIDAACTHISRDDVNCDCAVDVVDVVLAVGVAFRGASASTLCNACAMPCP